ncbi:MAG: S49 family peptidase [Gemmatimonadota bacterium]|nr:S49 family peptidase [Gemmatimonadota bacterium]
MREPATKALQLLHSTHWAITPEALETMMSVAAREHPLTPDALEAFRGDALQNTRRATVRDGVAMIPVRGPLFRYAGFFTEVSGATSYATIATDFTEALSNAQVKSIVLMIDSPGGEVNGIAELSSMIFAARGQKPIAAYVSGQGCSAAYWLASAADEIVVNATSVLGSIGCLVTFVDTRARDEASGVKHVEIVSSQSPKKNLDPMNDEGRAEVQALVDELAQIFVDAVARNRGVAARTVVSDFGQGGLMIGKTAIASGLADRLGSYESLLAELKSGAAPVRRTVAPIQTLAQEILEIHARVSAPIVSDADSVVTVNQAAQILGVSQVTAWKMCTEGKLKAQLVAGRYLIRRGHVLELKRLREQ